MKKNCSLQTEGVYIARQINSIIDYAEKLNIEIPFKEKVCYHHYNNKVEVKND